MASQEMVTKAKELTTHGVGPLLGHWALGCRDGVGAKGPILPLGTEEVR